MRKLSIQKAEAGKRKLDRRTMTNSPNSPNSSSPEQGSRERSAGTSVQKRREVNSKNAIRMIDINARASSALAAILGETAPNEMARDAKSAARKKAAKAVRLKAAPSKHPVQGGKRRKVRRVMQANGVELCVYGVTSRTGIQYVCVGDGTRSVWTPRSSWVGSGRDAMRALTAGGIVVVGSSAELCRAVARLRTFPIRTVIDRVGWSGEAFALPNRRIISADGGGDPVVLLANYGGVCDQAGTLSGWRDTMALLAGQSLPTFYLSAGLASVTLPFAGLAFNPGFELAGPAASGKTSLLRLVASIAGPGLDGPAGRYMIDLNATANGLEQAYNRFRYMPLVADEAALFMPAAGDMARSAGMVDLIFRNATGSTKYRYGGSDQVLTPFVWFVSTNQSLPTLLGTAKSDLRIALCDRLMSTPIEDTREYGIFDRLPEGVASASELIGRLMAGIGADYGVAMPAFLQRLVADHARDPDALRRRITQLMERFADRVSPNGVPKSASRVAQAFGLAYAAGMLAKEYDVLPASFRCLRAAQDCYNLHMLLGRPCPSVFERLMMLTQHLDVIDLDQVDPKTLTKKRVSRAPGLWHTNRRGEREFLILSREIYRRIPDWFVGRHEFDVKEVWRKDTKRDQKKRTIPGLGATWVYCFVFDN